MAIKIPLEMKNGVQVRTMSDLRENFDLERIIGYFLNGKLLTWLESRYYEEEAEEIQLLDKNDQKLAEKICKIFDVEYTLESIINSEEIERRNERISKLKQYTDDSEIINNIDLVAFDQEELSYLYDKNISKIYLCAGEFHIPKSKIDIEYRLIANPIVKGITTKEAKSIKNIQMYEIPLYISDKINMGHFVETLDYLVYLEYGRGYVKYSKQTCETNVINMPKNFEPNSVGDNYFYAYDNVIIFEAHKNLYPGLILIYDIENNKSSIVRLFDRMWSGTIGEKYVSEKKLAYSKNDNLYYMDLESKESFLVKNEITKFMGNWVAYKDNLFLSSAGKVTLYDVYNASVEKVILNNKYFETKFYPYNDEMYIIQYQYLGQKKKENFGFKIYLLKVINNNIEAEELLNLNNENIFYDSGNFNYNSTKYIPFVKKDERFALYVYNLDTKETRLISYDCGYKGTNADYANKYRIINDNIYYKMSKRNDIYRVNIETKRLTLI